MQDRYAVAEALPPVDSNQDWRLTSAEEDDGYTILEFNRNFTTCDDRDRNITVNMCKYTGADPGGTVASHPSLVKFFYIKLGVYHGERTNSLQPYSYELVSCLTFTFFAPNIL